MRLSESSLEVVAAVNRERFEHSHPEVRRKMLVVWLRSQGFDQATCATIADVSVRTVRRYLQQFQEGGLDRLRQIRWTGTDGRLAPYRLSLEEEFRQRPAHSVAEAADRIGLLTQVSLQPTQVRMFLRSLGLRWRRIGAIPVPPKTTVEEHVERQAEFLEQKLEPRLAEARAGRARVFFADAAHLVLGSFLCCLWCFERTFVRASSGRQRFNVLGAWNVISHELVSVCNTTVVNQQTFRELLSKIAALKLTGPITVVLDNARYQHGTACLESAASRGIALLFRPSYSPNLNLIERLWKFLKKDCLYAQQFAAFANFRARIETCLSQLGTTHKAKLAKLMTLKFQTFNNRSILAV